MANAIDHSVEIAGYAGVLGHVTMESDCSSVEEPPGGLIAPFMLRFFPLLGTLGDALDVDDTRPIKRHVDVIGPFIRQLGLVLKLDDVVLVLACQPQGLDTPRHQTRQIAFGVLGVPTPDHLVASEREVVAEKDARAE